MIAIKITEIGVGRLRRFSGLLVATTMACALPLTVQAEQGLGASSQTKVNKAKAQAWTHQDQKKDGYQRLNEKTFVNFGSKRGGTCAVNVGTAQPGEKAPKEIVVTTKEVINICK